MNAVKLAWRYVRYNRLKTAIMVACITLTMLLPISLTILLNQFNQQIGARANSTPFVVGSKGSQLDLALHAIYFEGTIPETLNYSNVDAISKDGLALAVPLYTANSAREMPVVGTTLDYFEFRKLRVERGEMLARIGHCVVGQAVARKLSLEPGDRLLTESTNVTDIAGAYPVNLEVVGVLEKTGTPDDSAIFVDIKTAWVIEGLGHGHDDIKNVAEDKIIGQDGNNSVASAAVLPFVEFDDQSAATVHFHGDMKDYPITSIIVVPKHEKAATILLGRINRDDSPLQMVEPATEVEKLMAMVFQIKRLFNVNAALLAVSTIMLLGLVVMLSLRLRKAEMETMFRLGCSRGTVILLQLAEFALIFAMATILVAICSAVLLLVSTDLIRWFSGLS